MVHVLLLYISCLLHILWVVAWWRAIAVRAAYPYFIPQLLRILLLSAVLLLLFLPLPSAIQSSLLFIVLQRLIVLDQWRVSTTSRNGNLMKEII